MNGNKNSNQYKARKLYEKMMNYFKNVYPEYYGGVYIDDDNNLNVLVIEGKQEMAIPLEEMGILLKPCQYTYNELNEAMNQINSFMIAHPTGILFKNFLSAFIDEMQNIVVVELYEHIPEYKDMFKEFICSSNAIKFVEPDYAVIDTEEIACGTQIISSKPSKMSLGFRAKKDAIKGFVTVGHSFPSLAPGKNLVFFNNKLVAISIQRENAGKIDAAFCEITDPEFEVTNKIARTGLELDTETVDAITGEIVNMVGWRSATAGKVVSTSFSTTINGIYFYDLVRVNYDSKRGDSGGIVYIYNPEKKKCYTVGIQKGIFIDEGIAFYSKAKNILQILGVTRY